MLTSLQYRLQQHESAPPAESWQNISLRLNEECQAEEIVISKKLIGYELAPPADLWNAITAGLLQPDTSSEFIELPAQFGWPSSEPVFDAVSAPGPLAKEPVFREPAPMEDASGKESNPARARIISFNWPRVAVAAAVLGVAISALYYFISQDSSVSQLTAKADPSKGKTGTLKIPEVVPGNSEPLLNSPGTNMAITSGARVFHKRNKSPLPVQQASYEPEFANSDISYANINGTDRVTSAENIAIPTQPIRDNQGNIIMDEKLISAPDVNYVTVTSPNGEQTKISKKFLHALSYMNAGSDDENIGIALQESALWKWLFKEWRQKLLTQPSFIPSTSNFLDIMELKEILHENF